jgi:hypothetical protein
LKGLRCQDTTDVQKNIMWTLKVTPKQEFRTFSQQKWHQLVKYISF